MLLFFLHQRREHSQELLLLGDFLFFFFVLGVILTPPPPVHLFICLLSLMRSLDTSVAIALNFNFSQNVLLRSCLYLDSICRLFLPLPFPSSRQNVFFHVSACTYIIWLCLPQSEINHSL